MEHTLGEKRIGSFNASGEGVIDGIKKRAAELIDYIDSNVTYDIADEINAGEVMRLKAMALTSVENASMQAVKAYIHYKK